MPAGASLRFSYNHTLDLLTILVGTRDRKEKEIAMRAGETSYRDSAGQLVRIQIRNASRIFPAEWLKRKRHGSES